MEKDHVKLFERELATKAGKRQQLHTEHRDSSQTASRSLATNEHCLRDLELEEAAMAAEMNE